MLNTLLVMIGGAIGAALRYQLGHASLRVMGPGYPWGTLAANVLGGFTTFSAFSLETMLMFERGELLSALGYILLSVAASIGALALGMTIMRSAAA